MRASAAGAAQLWGYLLHLHASGRLLLVVDCPSRAALAAAAGHAALAHIARQPHRHGSLTLCISHAGAIA